jgi:hypothetical protein
VKGKKRGKKIQFENKKSYHFGNLAKSKVKGKVGPRGGHEVPEGE